MFLKSLMQAIAIASESNGVVGIKLSSGEQVVSTLLNEQPTTVEGDTPWKLMRPCLLLLSPQGNMMIPWIAQDPTVESVEWDLEKHVIAVLYFLGALVETSR